METESNLSTQVTEQDLADAVKDQYGVLYSKDGKRLLKCDKLKWGFSHWFNHHYTVREGTEVICDDAFSKGGYGLKRVTIPGSVTTIGDRAFEGCTDLRIVTLGEGVAYIADSAFTWTIYLSKFKVAEGNANFRVEGNALYSKDMTTLVRCCPDSKSFEIPRSVRRLAGFAFDVCQCFESITIPAGVTEIGRGAFVNCINLVEFKVEDGNEHFCAKDGVLYSKDMRELICCPIAVSTPARKTFTVPESVVKICAYAFENCLYLNSVTIPSSVEEIGEGAFDIMDGQATIYIVCKEGEDASLVRERFKGLLPKEWHHQRLKIRTHNDYGKG